MSVGESWSGPLEPPIAADQGVRGTIVLELGLRLAFQLRDDTLGQGLAKLDAPLVEGVDAPDGALGEHAVFVECDQRAQRSRRQTLRNDCVRRAVAFKDPMRYETLLRAFSRHFLGRLPEGQRLGLREHICQEHVVMLAKRVESLAEGDEVARNQPGSLMNQLVERVLPVGPRLAPVYRARLRRNP